MHNLGLKEIAFELGFKDDSHLTKLFKKYKQITLSQYRENFKNIYLSK
ncbi:helix-turn-helix domain-containing protein [Myroides profundi]|nr:helix-turn-helix domain-containing protein [Myroides profundi]